MRKLIWLFAILFIVACESPKETRDYRKDAVKELNSGKLSFEEAYHKMDRYNLHEGKFTSEKHQYKMFITSYGKCGKMGITHDPNCSYCFELYD